MQVIKLGNLNGYTGGSFAYMVYDADGIAPTLNCMGGGGREPLIVEDFYSSRLRSYDKYAPAIRSERSGLKVVVDPISTNGTELSGCIRATYYKNGERNIVENLEHGLGYEGVIEPQVMTPKRTEYGKIIRKDYEAHNIYESRHNMTELEPRNDGIANTLTSVQKDNLLLEPQSVAMRGRYTAEDGGTEQHLELGDSDTSHSITTIQKDMMILEPDTEYVGIRQATKDGVIACEIEGVADLSYPTSKNRRGRVQGQGQISPTLTGSPGICRIEKDMNEDINIKKIGQISNDGSQCGTVVSENGLQPNLVAGTHGYANTHVATRYKIRKLHEKETWHLMDFSDEDFEKAAAVNSKTQLYKQAGNSIVVNCLVAIFGQMFEGHEDDYKKINTHDRIKEDKVGNNMTYFKEIYDSLENEDMKEFFKVLVKTFPAYFWEVGASSTDKYHPSYALGSGGLVRHTCAVVRFMNHTFAIESMNKWTSRERDMLRIAAAVHDSRKSGSQEDFEKSKYTKFEHPLLAAEIIRSFDGKYLTHNEVELIASTIESHMGAWNTNDRSSVVLPKPENRFQKMLHWADYLASRKDIEVKF